MNRSCYGDQYYLLFTKSSFQYLMEQVYQKEKKCLWIKNDFQEMK